jgi:molybdopterin synthase catalytic subunit
MIEISAQAIHVEELVAAVTDPEAGAIATFIGTTRSFNRGRKVTRLEYQVYEEMAVAELEKIAGEICERWGALGVAIKHRKGEVAVEEASVAIAVSTAHRREAIAACRYAIDRLKEVAPIWKKEYFEDGEVWIGSLADCDHG